jgi:integrase/recombinase XerD
MYTWGMEENIVKTNPFFKIKNLPEVERDYVRSLTSTEVKALLEASKGHYRVRWALYLYTGLRADNGNEITLDNIDMDRRIIHFPATMMKNSKAIDLPIHDKLYEILEEYIREEQPAHFLFPRRSLVAIRLKLKTDLKTAGIDQDGITLHALRHTFASSLLAEGVDIGTISKLLDHANISTTERYLHVHLHGLADKINRLKY